MLLPGTRTRSWAASILRCCVRKTLKEKTVGAPPNHTCREQGRPRIGAGWTESRLPGFSIGMRGLPTGDYAAHQSSTKGP